MWWNGPAFLLLPENLWPESIVSAEPTNELYKSEFKRGLSLTAVVTKATNIFNDWIENSSQLMIIKRKLAPIMRFIFNSRAKQLNLPRREGKMMLGVDMKDAEIALIRMQQIKFHGMEYSCLRKGKPIPRRSNILSLDPIFDTEYNLIRVGGRLRNSKIDVNQKHPILLPKSHLSKLFIREAHEKNLHAGQQTTLAILRQRYWPLNGKSIIRQQIRNCIRCFRTKPSLAQQKMGDLPSDRITPSYVFFNTGVDYAGPIDCKVSATRNAKIGKAYVALFICFSTKAIHLELVTQLTTKAFLAAFDRFISRRSIPCNMYSDNATNFVGARNELYTIYEFLSKQETQEQIHNFLKEKEINWHFIPPRAPNFGGLWEAGVKSAKYHLKRVIYQAALTYEELSTVLCKIEAVLNSRPLSPLSSDANDLGSLTPGHFLVGRPLVAKPDSIRNHTNITRLERWDRVTQTQCNFWNRWQREYLHLLQQRGKKHRIETTIHVGQLVLICKEETAPLEWPLARITKLYTGKDGLTRVAEIRTAKGNFVRSLSKLAILPIDDDKQSLSPGIC